MNELSLKFDNELICIIIYKVPEWCFESYNENEMNKANFCDK